MNISTRAKVAKDATIPQTLIVDLPILQALSFIKSQYCESVGEEHFYPNDKGEWQKYIGEGDDGSKFETIRSITAEELRVLEAFDLIKSTFKELINNRKSKKKENAQIASEYLNEELRDWNLSRDEENKIKQVMIHYAGCALVESNVRREVEEYDLNK